MRVGGAMRVEGELRVGSNFAVSASDLPIRIVWGIVNGNGDISSGKGFTAVRNNIGTYTVTFTTPFATRPCVVVTQHWSSGDIRGSAIVYSIGSSSCHIVTSDGQGAHSNRHFSFIAVGF
jgi:hypothetical protein